jgi:glycosyltransferase involved in cell wall biosynthesis
MDKMNAPKLVILSLDPRGVIIDGKEEVISRQNNYGVNLKKFNTQQKYEFIIFSGSKNKSQINLYESVRILNLCNPTFNFFKFAWKARKIALELNFDIKLFVVGDCWESYWSAFTLNFFLKIKSPIQIQLHGDIADPKWRKINYRNRARFLLAKLALTKASSIRAVTKYQAENLVKAFGIKREKIVVVPVPIHVLNKPVALKTERPKTIGLIGRIHQDRGIWDFINLIRILNSSSKDFKVVVIGDGPSKDKFLLKLSSVISKNRIIYLGQVPESQLRKAWKKIGVLVSMAPVESYGRVIRESLISGVPVWATASAGVNDLMDNCKKGEVKLLDLSKSESYLDKDFRSLLKTKVSSDFSKRFIKENNTYAAKLASSWINIINKSK